MRIAFIDVQTYEYQLEAPIGFMFLSHTLKKRAVGTPKLFTHMVGDDADVFVSSVAEWKPDVLGINCSCGFFASHTIPVIEKLSKALPDAQIVVGGVAATCSPEVYLSHPDIDYLCLGEGEFAFASACECIRDGKDPAEVPGICDQGNVQEKRRDIQIVHDLGDVDMDVDLLADWEPYIELTDGMRLLRTIKTSRGCAFRCSFCIRSGIQIPHRDFSDAQVLGWIYRIREKVEFSHIMLADENFFINKERSFNIIKTLTEKNIKLFNLDLRLSQVTDDLMSRLTKYEITSLFIGLESVCDDLLDIMNKKLTRKTIDQAVDVMRRWPDITVTGNILLGTPGTQKHHVREMLTYLLDAMETVPNFIIDIAPLILLPATTFYDDIVKDYPEYAINTVEDFDKLLMSNRSTMDWLDLPKKFVWAFMM